MIQLIDQHNPDLKAIVEALGGAGVVIGHLDRGAVSGAVTIDWSAGQIQRIILDGNVTLSFTGHTAGSSYFLVVDQASSGGPYTLTFPGGGVVRFSTDAPYTVSTAAGARDIVTLAAINFGGLALYAVGQRAFS